MSPEISIVIPTYNRIKSIPRAINSVINQTFQDWELLIVDDGSDDGTMDFINATYGNDPRIKCFSRPSSREKGANACRNIGIDKSRGKYIALLDSDDEWKNEYLEKCIKAVEVNDNFTGCYSGAVISHGNLSTTRNSRSIKSGESHIDFLMNKGFAPTPSLFMVKEFASDIKFDEKLLRHQDWDFYIRFGEKYAWQLNDTTEVVIHWSIDSVLDAIDFDSCIMFYQKHKESIANVKSGNDYLFHMYKRAILQKDETAITFYRDELKDTNIKTHIFYRRPYVFIFIATLAINLKLNYLIFYFRHIKRKLS